MEEPQKIIEEMFERGILLNQDMLNKSITESLKSKLEEENDLLVLNKDYLSIFSQSVSLVDWYEVDQYRVEVEKERDEELYQNHLQQLQQATLSIQPLSTSFSSKQELTSLEAEVDLGKELPSPTVSLVTLSAFSSPTVSPPLPLAPLSVIISYQNLPHKYEIKDFTNYFISRYRFLEGMLRYRQELPHVLAIGRLLSKKEADQVSIIGLISDIGETKNGNIYITLEDLTGKIKIFFSKNKPELLQQAKDLVFDEVIGVHGRYTDKVIFADTLVWPDLPLSPELKKSEKEEYAIFLSDIHVGSTLFLKEEFHRFLRWINGQAGNDLQREMAQKVRYIFIAGDLVDGVGIYPAQEEELEIKEIKAQYEEFCRLIKQIPTDKQIVMCPGNHDVVHLAEPQPIFYKEYASQLFELPNVTLVTNPALVNIGKTEKFPGFDVLLYHGYSFDYYIANVESIRTGGGYHRSDLIMKFLLKRRHLAPTFKSTPYFPAHSEDPLVLRKIPDIFITGHIHYCCVANYRGVIMISGSCWQGKTAFQEKLGHDPEPARVPLVNLQTREIKVLKFI